MAATGSQIPFRLPAGSTENDASYLAENNLYCGDCRMLLPRVRPESVALSFWSPPYCVGKSYEKDLNFKQWQALIRESMALHYKIIIPGGFMAINIADILVFSDPSMPRFQADNISHKRSGVTKEQVLDAMDANPNMDRHQIADLLGCSEQTVDRRMKNNNARGGKNTPQSKVMLVGGMMQERAERAGFYLYDRRAWVKDPGWENSQWHGISYRAVDEFEYVYIFWKPGVTVIDRERLSREEWSEWGSRAVWHIPSVANNSEHEAQFPLELPRRVVKIFSGKDDMVLDPFMGTGTTLVAAAREGRRYMGFDVVPEYADIALARMAMEPMS